MPRFYFRQWLRNRPIANRLCVWSNCQSLGFHSLLFVINLPLTVERLIEEWVDQLDNEFAKFEQNVIQIEQLFSEARKIHPNRNDISLKQAYWISPVRRVLSKSISLLVEQMCIEHQMLLRVKKVRCSIAHLIGSVTR
ncbi:hypothetical protein L1987_47126 [Smallanthus sonchifolius]|uniref:Uncharacterized protein n=1 Tax=Smallanthus sonchifolius TaxID=185202 RepID=A0ACB9G2R8_9ASTR|nr:hypothetical protein L1987_47126 [Smallanthus sonchifolius]